MTVEQLVDKVKATLSQKDLSAAGDKLAIQVDLTGKNSGVFYIEVLNGVLSVMPYEYNDRDARISIAMTNFEKLLAGKLDPKVAYATGKLKAEGDLGKVLALAEILK